MAQLTKAQLATENQNDFPNNNSGLITPAILRDFNTDMIDSLVDEVSYNIDSASFSASISQLQTFSSSLDATFATDAQLTSLSASIAVTDLAQSSSIAALQQFSSSLDATFATDAQLTSLSSSIAVTDLAQSASIAQLLGFSSSIDTGFVSEAEFGAYTSSNDSKVNSLISKTGSYATTGSNSFIGNQNITGAVTASSARISGLNYPTTDGTFSGQVLQTNAAGTLSFGNVNAVFENIRNGEATQITKGTPLYVSGAQGDTPIVYRADATNPAKMPVTFLAMENINSNATGRGITLGLITGIDMTGYPVGTQLWVDGLGLLTDVRPTGSTDIVQPIAIVTKTGNGGQINVLNPGPVLLPNIATNKVWVGNTTNQPAEVSTSALGLALTGSNNSFNGTQTFNNITVNGTASFAYTQNVTGSAVIIGEEYIILNNQTPTAPYAGLKVYDSGSSNVTASLLWDGVNNHWVYEQISGAAYGAGGFLSGPTGSSLSTITYPSANRLVKGGGEDHLYDSNISDNGSIVSSAVNVEVTGSVTATGGFIGNASTATTASFANTASFVQSSSFAANAGLLDGKDSTEFATTSSNVFVGNQIVSASVYVRNGDLFNIGVGTTVNPDLYLTESVVGQANIIKGWGDNPAAGGAGATQANYTGSLRITGSNNIVSLPQIRATGLGGGADQQGYISGSDNVIGGNLAGIYLNTGSQLFPKISNNQLSNQAAILMNFTTSSLAGGHPTIQLNSINAGTITLNSNSGSIQALSTNIVNAGGITSTQNFVTNVRPTITSNIINGNSVTINHISSSANLQSNIINSPVTVNNHLSSSGIATNQLNFNSNAVLGGSTGTGLGVWVSGSQSSNAARTIIDNLIGGKNIIVSSSFVSSSNSSLVASLIYGQNLVVNGNNSTTSGGSTFVGRFNDSGSLANSQDIVFAVGTGVAAGTRRTGLWIDTGSNTTISGSLSSKGNSAFSGSVDVSGSTTTLQNLGGIALAVRSGSVEITSPQGTGYFYSNLPMTSSNLRINGPGIIADLFVSGVFSGNSTLNVAGASTFTGSVFTSASVSGVVNPLTISSQTASLDFSKGNFFTIQLVSGSATHINPTNIAAGQTINIRVNTTGSGTVTFPTSVKQVSGSAYVPTTATGVDVLTMVTFDASNIYLANVKNLV